MISLLLGVFLSSTSLFANPLEHRKTFDASASRGLLLPSAETLNKGQFTVSSIEILFYNVSYGINDNTMISFSSILPIAPGIPLFGTLSGKCKLLSNKKFQFSVQPNMLLLPSDTVAGTFGVQFVSDISLFDSGNWLLTLAANPQFIYGSLDEDTVSISDGVGGLLGVSIQGYLHPRVKLMVEAIVPGAMNFESGESAIISEAFLLNYGTRFPGENISFDVSFIRPIEGGFYLGFPFVTATGRFN